MGQINQILNYAKLNGKSVRNEVYAAIGRKMMTPEEVMEKQELREKAKKMKRPHLKRKSSKKKLPLQNMNRVEKILNNKYYIK